MMHSAWWICDLVALGVAAFLHSIRRWKRRRSEHLYEIQPFLRGTSNPGDCADGRFKGNWTEIHPLPRHISMDED